MADLPVLRIDEQYLLDFRNSYTETYTQWKERIRKSDLLLRGDWPLLYPNMMGVRETPMVTNLGETFMRDVARLVSEVPPAVRSSAKGESEDDKHDQLMREAVADTYWVENHGETMVPQLAMDLVETGTCFTASYIAKDEAYPRIMRLDPRFCYPDFHNGKLQELLVVQRMKMRIADKLWPDAGIRRYIDDRKLDEGVEVWDYYGPNEYIKGIALMQKGTNLPVGMNGIVIVDRWEHKAGRTLASGVQLPSHDGAIRGLLDQIGGSLVAKNRIASLMVKYAEQQVYSPFEAKNVLNANQKPGPNTIYQHDPTSPESFIRRVPPAGSNPQLFALQQMLDAEQRAELGYPESRQGNVSQSIASAAFVASTQGQLTSVIREIQRFIGNLRADATEVCFHLDETWKNDKKALSRAVGKRTMYTPKSAIDGVYRVRVVYGAGAGLDRNTADTRVLNYFASKLISAETSRDQIDFLEDSSAEQDKIERETVAGAVLQRFLTDPQVSVDALIEVFNLQRGEGIGLADAIAQVKAQMGSVQNQQPQSEAQPGLPQQESMQEQVLATQQGGVPQQGQTPEQLPQAVEFAPPPTSQVIIR